MWCRAFWIREWRSCNLIRNTWAAPVQWAAPCHWLITFSFLQRENILNNKTKWLFYLWSVTWIGSLDIRLGVSRSKVEVGKGFRKEGVGAMTSVAVSLPCSPIPLKPALGTELTKYVKTKCWIKKTGSEIPQSLSSAMWWEYTVFKTSMGVWICWWKDWPAGQSIFLLWTVSVEMYSHFASIWLDNIWGVCAVVASTAYVKFSAM